jgi:hypothetical protein
MWTNSSATSHKCYVPTLLSPAHGPGARTSARDTHHSPRMRERAGVAVAKGTPALPLSFFRVAEFSPIVFSSTGALQLPPCRTVASPPTPVASIPPPPLGASPPSPLASFLAACCLHLVQVLGHWILRYAVVFIQRLVHSFKGRRLCSSDTVAWFTASVHPAISLNHTDLHNSPWCAGARPAHRLDPPLSCCRLFLTIPY